MILTGPTHDLQSSLFSAIVVAFLIRAVDELEPDYQQQTALLLHQLLNGRDPNLANISDPNVPEKHAGLAVAVCSLWCTTMSLSLSASIYAMAIKIRVAGYCGNANHVGGLIGACQRYTRLKGLEKMDVPDLVAFLQMLLIYSISSFSAGGIIYAWQRDKTVMAIFTTTVIVSRIVYLRLFVSTTVENLPLPAYPAFISHRPSSFIGKAAMLIVGEFVRSFYRTLRCLIAIPSSIVKIVLEKINTPGEHEYIPVGRAITLHNPRDGAIGISQEAQDNAILWLSQVPVDPSESSSTLVSSSRPCDGFQESVVVLVSYVLEASFCEVSRERTDVAIDCVLVLGDIKFQSAVDRNSDCDHDIGGIPLSPFVAWAAQQLAVDAFQPDSDIPHSEGSQELLLAAAAWLSPTGGDEDFSWGGQVLKIQDRREFIETIKMMLERHVRRDDPLDSKILISLIHGMHASIPRGNYSRASSVVHFLSIFCEDYDSPWSEDEAVLRALITYALDLILPPERSKPLASRRIEFDDLASELIDALMAVNTPHPDAVALALQLARRVPYAFRSRNTVLADIAHIWHRTNEKIPEDYRDRLNLHATDAFIAIAQRHAIANGELPRLPDYTALKLPSATLGSGYNRPMTIYTMAMILYLGTTTQATPVTNDIDVGSITDALFSSSDDPEKGAAEEDVVDARIYSTLILLKLVPTVKLDVERVKGLIVRTEETIGYYSFGNPGVAKSSEAGVSVDLDRTRWKAIYLSALLLKFLPGDEREKHIEGLWTRVWTLLRSGELSFVGDYERCLEPLGMDVSGLGTLGTDQQGQIGTVFGVWIDGFPLFQPPGAVIESPPSQECDLRRPRLFSPRRWFG